MANKRATKQTSTVKRTSRSPTVGARIIEGLEQAVAWTQGQTAGAQVTVVTGTQFSVNAPAAAPGTTSPTTTASASSPVSSTTSTTTSTTKTSTSYGYGTSTYPTPDQGKPIDGGGVPCVN